MPTSTKRNTLIHYQLPAAVLSTQSLERQEGASNDTGALVIHTGAFTGRSPLDKFIVLDQLTEDTVDWNKFNQSISENNFMRLRREMLAYLDRQTELWIRDGRACANPAYSVNLRFINETPSSNLFVANMFLSAENPALADFPYDWLVLQAPGFKADPRLHGTRQENFTVMSFTHRTILIGGTGYTGEIKKSVFTALNFTLPLQHRVLSMHCSANEGPAGDTALFFGLSGTGKTTLSADPGRMLIGDDEHGWSDDGVFNFEGGCYAKIINLSAAQEPGIFDAIRPGALVENTCFEPDTNRIAFADKSITENTRVSYPLDFVQDRKNPSRSGVPDHIFFLTCDAYGVLPPLSRLNQEQAMYYFINGYTARIAGTENGVSEPQATFSACFGAPFLPLHPLFYAELLREKLERHGTEVWMINTGWTGGPYGTGRRIPLSDTRQMINAVLTNAFEAIPFYPHSIFGVFVPERCPGISPAVLDPEATWTDKAHYRSCAARLLAMFDAHSRSGSFS